MSINYLKTLFPGTKSQKESRYTLLPTSRTNSTPASRDSSLDSSAEPSSACSEKAQSSAPAPPRVRKPLFRVDARVISDATIGLADGLTVPFALTAGLSTLGDTRLVIYAGLAELIAGGISMGLGGYLGAAGEAQAYQATLSETKKSISEDATVTRHLIASTFSSYGFSDDLLDAMATQLLTSEAHTEDFLMHFHHRLPESGSSACRPYVSALTIALGYFLGGLVGLTPYFVFETNGTAFLASVAVMAVTLFAFGWFKTLLVGEGGRVACARAGVQMMVLGGVAAAAAMGCVKAIAS